MSPATNKERQRKYYQKMKDSVEFKEKMRQRSKVNRCNAKKDNTKMQINRQQSKARMRKMRLSKKSLIADNKVEQSTSAYKCRATFGKAMKKIKSVLPASPRKKIDVIKQLASEIGIFHKPRSNTLKTSEETVHIVQTFYKRDDLTWTSPNMKDVNAKAEQCQYLMMTISEAYRIFQLEYPQIRVGKSKFADLRPNNVMIMNKLPHLQCLCKHHQNFNLLLEAINFISPGSPKKCDDFLIKLCCDVDKSSCAYYNNCEQCCHRIDSLQTLLMVSDDYLNVQVDLKQWSTMDGRIALVGEKTTIGSVLNLLKEKTRSFKMHSFVNKTQKRLFKDLRDNISDTCAIVQIDFSENFTIKTQNEIQSAYFAHGQISIFTAVIWLRNKVESFAFASDNLNHDKVSVFYYVDQIISFIKAHYSKVSTLDIFSDGAASQFKQRYTLSTLFIYAAKYNLKLNWNFFATSHGKGAVDDVGASVKSVVWRKIKANKCIIHNAQDFCRAVSNPDFKINVIHVDPKSIENNTNMLADFWCALLPIPDLKSYHCIAIDLQAGSFLTCKHFAMETAGYVFYHNSENISALLSLLTKCNSFAVGNKVLVKYNNALYPGEIMEIGNCEIRVKCMTKVARNMWIWPSKQDISFYSVNDATKISDADLIECGTSTRISHYKLSTAVDLRK